MISAKTNLINALNAERKNAPSKPIHFENALHEPAEERQQILNKIFGSAGEIGKIDVRKLDEQNIYSIREIEQLCVKYRLRFLDGKHFKGDIPEAATAKIKELQKGEKLPISGYKIIAPAGMFTLRHRDRDPLLMVNLGNDFYYLIHQWGRDLHPLRKLMVFPFRSFETLFGSVVALALLVALAIPSSVMISSPNDPEFGIRGIVFFYFFFAFSGLTALYGFKHMQNFSNRLWKSEYFS